MKKTFDVQVETITNLLSEGNVDDLLNLLINAEKDLCEGKIDFKVANSIASLGNAIARILVSNLIYVRSKGKVPYIKFLEPKSIDCVNIKK